MNSPPSFCVKYEISSKLEHLPFLVKKCGLKGNRYQYWQASRITKNYCQHWIHQPRFVQNFIKIGRFAIFGPKLWPKRWQVPLSTGVNNDRRHKLIRTVVTIEFTAFDLCRVRNIKIEAFTVLRLNYGLQDDRCQYWQLSRITESYCHQWIQHLQVVHHAKFRGKWLTSFPFPFLKIAYKYHYVCTNQLTWKRS